MQSCLYSYGDSGRMSPEPLGHVTRLSRRVTIILRHVTRHVTIVLGLVSRLLCYIVSFWESSLVESLGCGWHSSWCWLWRWRTREGGARFSSLNNSRSGSRLVRGEQCCCWLRCRRQGGVWEWDWKGSSPWISWMNWRLFHLWFYWVRDKLASSIRKRTRL